MLAFARGDRACYLNLSGGPVALPGGAAVLLASQPLTAGELAPDTAVWLRLEQGIPNLSVCSVLVLAADPG